jgi:hypothetical protein
MSARDVRVKRYIVSAHPYAFDALFAAGGRWNGSGQVKLFSMGGGVNQAWALVEADDEGYQALNAAGFTVKCVRKDSVRPPKTLSASMGKK